MNTGEIIITIVVFILFIIYVFINYKDEKNSRNKLIDKCEKIIDLEEENWKLKQSIYEKDAEIRMLNDIILSADNEQMPKTRKEIRK